MGREVSFERDDLSDNQYEARKSSPLTANPEAQVFVWGEKCDGKLEIDNGVVGSNSFKASDPAVAALSLGIWRAPGRPEMGTIVRRMTLERNNSTKRQTMTIAAVEERLPEFVEARDVVESFNSPMVLSATECRFRMQDLQFVA